MAQGIQAWRARFRRYLDEIAAIYPPRDEVDLDVVADMVTAEVEGGIILSKTLKHPKSLSEQILIMRSYIKLLFSPPSMAGA